MSNFETEQEVFWAGQFGSDYIKRNSNQELFSSNIRVFSDLFNNTKDVQSVIELGANIGMNMHAVKTLKSNLEITAIEINKDAYDVLKNIPNVKAHNTSILDFKTEEKFDLVFTKGVLIHINPENLDEVYKTAYNLSKKYICFMEYYNPTPVELNYHGHSNKLFKRDFAGDMMKKYKDLELVAYKFYYKNDNNFKQDDITCFLLKKV